MSSPTIDTVRIPGFRIEKRLGQGGTATVYLAIQKSLDRRVAIKVQNTVLADDPSYSQRFLNEGRIIASLNHKNIITIHDVGVADGLHYITMEYVSGGDLNARLATGIVSREALQLVRTLASALHAAHQAGVVHRDVKPGNILFRADGTVLLTDFGIAKRVQDNLTLNGTVLGTPGYLSPEQARGEAIDERSDVYGLGIIFYEMLTGKRPYQAETQISTILKQLEEPIPDLPRELRHFQPLLNRMIARDPADRFPDMAALQEALDGSPDRSRQANNARPGKWALAGGVAMIAVSVAVFAGVWLLGDGDEDAAVESVVRHHELSSYEDLTTLGQQALAAGHLVEPHDGSALAYFQAAVARDADDQAAQTGLSEIASHYTQIARDAWEARDFASARTHANFGLQARPDDPHLRALLRETDETLAHVDNLLAAAEAALADFRLTTPERDNALHYYDQVLAIAPNESRAINGRARIVEHYLTLAEEKIATYQYADARELIRRGLAIQPDNGQLLALRGKATIERAPAQLVEDIKGLFK